MRVIKPVDVLEDDRLGLAMGLLNLAPDQFDLHGLEERLDNGVTWHGQLIGKVPRYSSTKLNLMTKTFVLPGKLTVLGRNHICVTVCAHSIVKGRKAAPKPSAIWRRGSLLVSATRTASLRVHPPCL